MNRKWIAWIAVAVLGIGGYFVAVEWQTWRGQAALADTHLDFKPLPQALALAKTEGKPVLADFSAIWCPTCRALHETVFTDAAVKNAINGSYVLTRVDFDSEEGKAFMRRYDVQGFPTLLVLDGDGKLIRRLPFTLDPATFRASLGG